MAADQPFKSDSLIIADCLLWRNRPVTLAGDADALAEIGLKLTADGVFNKKLEVEVPYHSSMMDPIMDDLTTALASVQPSLPTVPLYSTVTGALVEEVAYGAEYLPLNVR